MDATDLWSEHQPPVFIDREMLDFAAEEISLCRGFPEARRRAERGRCERHGCDAQR
jgi:hypothetical protein